MEVLLLGNPEDCTQDCNEISGNFPDSIFQMSGLRILDLGNSIECNDCIDLTGDISSALRDLNDLEELDIAFNEGLTGDLPSTMSEFVGLERLLVNDTNITGLLPDLHNLLKLTAVDFSETNLLANLPYHIWQRSDLGLMTLIRNTLSIDEPADTFIPLWTVPNAEIAQDGTILTTELDIRVESTVRAVPTATLMLVATPPRPSYRRRRLPHLGRRPARHSCHHRRGNGRLMGIGRARPRRSIRRLRILGDTEPICGRTKRRLPLD